MQFKKHDRRLMRVEKEIQQSLASFFLRDLQLGEDGLVSVTRVQMPKDLKTARVYVHLFGGDQSQQESFQETLIEKLERRTSQAQRHLSQDLNLRYCPKIEFIYDRGFDKTLIVDRLIFDMTHSGAFKKNNETAD